MKKIYPILIAVVLCLISASCENELSFLNSQQNDFVGTTDIVSTTQEEDIVRKALDGMSTEEKICQLFIVRPEALDLSLDSEQIGHVKKYGRTELSEEMAKTLKKYPVGGVVMFSKNIKNPQQIKSFISQIQESSEMPMFIGVDEEGGLVSRIASNPEFDVIRYKNMESIGKSGDVKNAYDVGKNIGAYLKDYGFNLDFAPIADANTNPDNTVIGARSFGSDPKMVSEMVSNAIDGFHTSKIMCSIKHFPGHGDTKGDTHKGFVSIDKTWDELCKCELIPFVNNIQKTDMVMTAHISTPRISENNIPASLSYHIITKKLRGELGYRGVVITDSLEMGAVVENYSCEEAAVMALKAGADIILMPYDLEKAYNAIYYAIESGEISIQRLDESVYRILMLKKSYNLLKP